jgi:hypothetical protein
MLLPPPDIGAVYVDKSTGQPSKDLYNWVRSLYETLRGLSTVATVASLPTAGVIGRRSFVSDANATTFASIVAGGGANKVPVYDDGTNWRVG